MSMPRAIETAGCSRVPAPATLPSGVETKTHWATTPSVPSQLSSAKPGSIGSAFEILLQAYSHPQTPVAGFPSRSQVPAGQVVPLPHCPAPSPGSSLPGVPSIGPSGDPPSLSPPAPPPVPEAPPPADPPAAPAPPDVPDVPPAPPAPARDEPAAPPLPADPP